MSSPAPRTEAEVVPRYPTLAILNAAGYAYLLRVPVLIYLFTGYLAAAGIIPGLPGESLIRGIFDIAWSTEEHFVNGLRFALATLATLTLCGSLTIAARTVCLGAHSRFRLRKMNDSRGPRLLYLLPSLGLAAFILIGIVRITSVSLATALAGEFAGIVAFASALFISRAIYNHFLRVGEVPPGEVGPLRATVRARREAVKQTVERIAPALKQAHTLRTAVKLAALLSAGSLLFAVAVLLANLAFSVVTLALVIYLDYKSILILRSAPAATVVPGDTEGYAESEDKPLFGQHIFATILFMVSFSLYAIVFLFNDHAPIPGQYFKIPTLALVLLLLILICWAFTGLSFFLDRYRIPLLLPVVAWAWFSSSFAQSDHFFAAIPAPNATGPMTPAAILDAGATPPVLVAATGGGIQAASWSARVLRGLQAQAQVEKLSFADSVRLVSSVSGGSVGTMYFQSMYSASNRSDCAKSVVITVASPDDPDRIAKLSKNINDDCVVRAAEASSLDEIAFGLVYPDLFLNLFPFIKGVELKNGRIVNGNGILNDRARALENSFKRGAMPGLDKATLLGWKEEVARGTRPASIFNATIVETGERLLFSTTDLHDPSGDGDSYRPLGRVTFNHLHPKWDVQIATAARLSATFPFVTPAARIFQGDIFWPADHVVDGGYFDNFGMASLVEWLDEAIGFEMLKRDIMIVEIRSSAVMPLKNEMDPGLMKSRDTDRGFMFQFFHPATTMWNVRGTSQFSHNEVELRLLQDALPWGRVCRAVFEYRDQARDFHIRPEPLSWHLTRDDITSLSGAWQHYLKDGTDVRRVMQFLKEGTCPKM